MGLVFFAYVELWAVRRAYKQKVLETHPDKLPRLDRGGERCRA